ncbi:hypothetical protein ACFO1B_42310 [Dactylosporangium siamense]|uniref:Uncharacterized protein n=1 Tax=Dactylosporangium siamense TaxID=685454 RepID=A0A919UD44_9ACTN|nr:hypothetical protein [Dactylosporangium siamense]GIG51057.1 hypothetical protein Dsi01nite_090980 [Dactylosporangium siamense]
MAEPEPNQGWHLPDGAPPSTPAPVPPPSWAPPTQPTPYHYEPPEPGPRGIRRLRRGPLIAILAGVVVLVACVGGYGYTIIRLGHRTASTPTTRAPRSPVATQRGLPGTASASPGGGRSAGPARAWVLVAPAQAGTLRRSADTTSTTAALARQRQAGVTDPYATAYEDAVDTQYWALVTGQVGARFTAQGPQAAVDGWLATQAPVPASTTYWGDRTIKGRVPPRLGGVAACRDDRVQDNLVSWCAWAAEGVIVQFVFQRMPAEAARDRMAEMLPDIVTWT